MVLTDKISFKNALAAGAEFILGQAVVYQPYEKPMKMYVVGYEMAHNDGRIFYRLSDVEAMTDRSENSQHSVNISTGKCIVGSVLFEEYQIKVLNGAEI